MHLISTLASGVKGAEGGTAEIFVRGTATRATYYSDYGGLSAVSTGSDVTLDANGGATIYVNQSVDVVVKNTSASQVRFFTEMASAPLTEYIGASFTGTDYTTGASAASKPATLQDILNAWFTSAGAVDFNVLLEGSASTIQAALGTVSGFFFNVKSSTYGATGDGATDDTTAIASAITAATASGGVVFFPAGTYLVTSSIALPADVSLLGLGSDISIITMNHASNNLLTLSGASSGGFQSVRGIGFTAAQSYSGNLLQGVTEETFVKFEGCSFGGANTTACLVNINIDHSAVTFDTCYFAPGEIPTTWGAVQITSSAADDDLMWANFTGCTFKVPATQTATNVYLLKLARGAVSGSRFDCSAMSNAVTVKCLYFHGTIVDHKLHASAVGNAFIGSSTATVYGIDGLAANMDHYESGNVFSADCTGAYGLTSFASQSSASVQRLSREARYISLGTDNGAGVTIPSLEYANVTLLRSDNTVQVLSALAPAYGQWLTIIIRNTNGGAATGNITFSSSYFAEDIGAFTVAASSHRIFTFRGGNRGTGNNMWGLVGYTGDI